MCEYCLQTHGHLMGCPNAPEEKEIGECASCGCTIYDGDEYDESIRGDILCADCALEQRLMAAEYETEREK